MRRRRRGLRMLRNRKLEARAHRKRSGKHRARIRRRRRGSRSRRSAGRGLGKKKTGEWRVRIVVRGLRRRRRRSSKGNCIIMDIVQYDWNLVISGGRYLLYNRLFCLLKRVHKIGSSTQRLDPVLSIHFCLQTIPQDRQF